MTFSINDLIEKADKLAYYVYDLTMAFPKEEQYCLTSQLRRSILSVPANIIEGYSRNRPKLYRNHIEIAYASLAESKYFLKFARQRGYITEQHYMKVFDQSDELSRVLWSIIKKLDQ